MGHYETAKICLNGHMITSSMETMHDTDKFCTICGQATITCCTNCNSPIHGSYYAEGIFNLEDPPVPSYCHNCGHPYPWIEERLKAAENIINMLDSLTNDQKRQLIDFIPDITMETPRSEYAALIYAKLLDGLQGFVVECLKHWCEKNVLPSLLVLMNMQK